MSSPKKLIQVGFSLDFLLPYQLCYSLIHYFNISKVQSVFYPMVPIICISWLLSLSNRFGKKNGPPPIGVITTSEGWELEVVTSYKYLRVWLDGALSFSQHISNLQAKVQSRLGFLHRNHSSFTPAAKLTLIQMTIPPMLDYGDIIYRSFKVALECLYHSAIRFATNAPYMTHPCTL